jgi:tetratricopeptide (TPR) repeat protein
VLWRWLGHAYFLLQQIDEAGEAYAKSLQYAALPTIDAAMQLRIGEIALAKQKYSEAKDAFLASLRIWRSSRALLGIGVASLQTGSYIDAEHALCEAHIQNPHSGDIWGYLSLLYATLGKAEEAAAALKEALRLSLKDLILLSRIAQQLATLGVADQAEQLKLRIQALSEANEA